MGYQRKHRFEAHVAPWQHVWIEGLLVFIFAILMFVTPASAAMRFQERSLYMKSTLPDVVTSYTISFRYMSPTPIGSVEMLFCIDPIPYHDCEVPQGLDVSQAVLSDQLGEIGFSIMSKTTNRVVLSRIPGVVTNPSSSYTLKGIKNPSKTDQSFSVRLKSHSSADASGPEVDFGSVKGQISEGIVIETQVPPMLIFCVAERVDDNCVSTNENFYANMGQLDSETTLVAQSQMAVGTNATGGFVITANGVSMSAGTTVIDTPSVPTQSNPGSNQFGINLVENTSPAVGTNPQGDWANAVPSPNYSIPNHYMYIPGDVIAYSPNVSLMKKFTVSYIVNASAGLKAGVYGTTITYIASGRF